jgi:mannan endo-1,4-beta-mannosidase
LSEVILAFDIQNEPMIASPGKLVDNDPDDWLCGRAGNMKAILGSSTVKIATGGVGGSQYDGHEYNLLSKALYCSATDIMSVHGYMYQASNWGEFIPSLADQAAAQAKHLMIEEWGVGTSSSMDSIADQAAVFNDNGVPWLYWMIIPGMSVDESCDGQGACCHKNMSTDVTQDFEVGLNSGRADWGQLIGTADSTTGRQDWTGYVY